MNIKVNKSKKIRALTYEEHQKIDAFLQHFHNEGIQVFALLRECFSDNEEPVIRMAKAVNLMSCIHQYCETKACSDRLKYPPDGEGDYKKWHKLYYHIGLWHTEGWERKKKNNGKNV